MLKIAGAELLNRLKEQMALSFKAYRILRKPG